jgi:hypothetical protein
MMSRSSVLRTREKSFGSQFWIASIVLAVSHDDNAAGDGGQGSQYS